jgi:hypothetical protein
MQLNGKSESVNTDQKEQTYNWQTDSTVEDTGVFDDTELTRDAEDVDFKEIDDE